MFRLARHRFSRVLATLVAASFLAVGLASLDFASAAPADAAHTAPAAQTAIVSGFDPGNIIDDALFWDPNAMTVSEIQAFLNARVSQCQSGYTCLRDYRESTRTIPASPMCTQYNGAASETAATIIWKVAQACGVSPKVILVTLQKEQGLVTHTAPSAGRYRAAMGAGCPDTAPCDSEYYGFFNQVHYGAFLLKRYTQPPGTGPGTPYPTRFDLRYAVGQVSAVLFHPNSACGAKNVYIANQATHALYVYTPYTPNDAALAAGYGTGDSCSSYGNRNFYRYYSDWFGSVRGHPIGVYFREYHAANSGWLSWATGPMTCGGPNGGCHQFFLGGLVTSSTHTSAMGVRRDLLPTWGSYGREYGVLGYPVAERQCADMAAGACRQQFQGGWIVAAAAADPRVVFPAEFAEWSRWGREHGVLGFPLGDRVCDGPTCFQDFQGGTMVSASAVGIHLVPAAVMPLWRSWGREYGILGLPTGQPSVPGGSSYTQTFQGGTVTVTNGTGMVTSVADPWFNAVLTNTWLGTSQSARTCGLPQGGCMQQFQNGVVVSSPAGSFAVPTTVLQTWGSWGREYGVLGYPSGAPSTNPPAGTYTQTFQGGTVTVTNGTGMVTSVADPWFNAVLTNTWLGTSQSARTCGLPQGGCMQQFQNGVVVSSPAGSFAVPTTVLQTWGSWGREYGVLGYPSGAPSTNPPAGTYTQTFQGGTVTVTNGTGMVTSVADPWFNAVLTNTWLGTSQSARTCGLPQGGCMQQFQNGVVVSSPAGSFAVPTTVLQTWGSWGREYGVLGYPSGAPSTNPPAGTYTQTFQGGTVTVTNGTGMVTSVADPWFNAVLTNTWLGTSQSARTCGLPQGGCMQQFQNGVVVSSPAGSFAVPTTVLQTWGSWGREYGVLGYPSGAPSTNPPAGTYTQTFQGGTVTVTNGTGMVTSVADPWFNAVLTNTWLGTSQSARTCGLPQGGCMQQFQNGVVVSSPAGSFAVPTTVLQTWGSWGREYGVLGYPSGAPSTNPPAGTYTQTFQGGTVTVTNGTGTVVLKTP